MILHEKDPLAVKVRPQGLDAFVGQEHVLGEGKLLRRAIISQRIASLLLWGPAGCGKTTLGLIVAKTMGADFECFNAAFATVSVIKKAIEKGKEQFQKTNTKTVIFIDEIHRFNKLQQESLVPDTENARIILIGTTIYNPHYYIIPSLISRSLVANFKALTKENIQEILCRALQNKSTGLERIALEVKKEALEYFALYSNGDARKALSALELAIFSTPPDKEGRVCVDIAAAKESIQKNIFYDRGDSYHYDTISAFIKSVRGSDVDSALYWLARMIVGGEDPRFIARRLVILASEDIGNAQPMGLLLAASCFKAVEYVGSPEADLILAQVTIFLAASPKSNSAAIAIQRAKEEVENEETKEVPAHIKTHSQDYKYPHAYGGYVSQDYGIHKKFYVPLEAGEEKKLKEFLEKVRSQK